MEEPSVALRGIWKTYDGRRHILRGIDLDLLTGHMGLIAGRSGTGKSTLLNIIAGLEPPSHGRVLLDGHDLSKLSTRQLTRIRLRKVGIVLQTNNLVPEMDCLENVMLPLKLARVRFARERAEKLFRHFGIEEMMYAHPAQISGGEQQRVAIARALANQPSIILADEPTASLDEENAIHVMETFIRVNREFSTTILIASHDPIVFNAIPERYRLEHGRLVTAV